MFSHLKPENFVNLIEGEALPAKYQAHLDGCARCRETWQEMQSMHGEFASSDAGLDIPEPDWQHFRSSVRDELLSRSIQRQTAVRRVVRQWTGWSINPALAWGLSLVMAIGLTTATFLWRSGGSAERTPVIQSVPPAAVNDVAADSVELNAETNAEAMDAGPERSLFQDVVSLGAEEQEQFRALLEAPDSPAANPQ